MPDKVVLLYGNHDYAYLPKVYERNNCYDSHNAKTITSLFVENEVSKRQKPVFPTLSVSK